MSGGRLKRPVPRIGLTRDEAATAIGVSLSTFKNKVQPDLPVWRSGKLRIFPVAAIEQWLADNSERILDDLESPQARKKSPREAGTSGGQRRVKENSPRRGKDSNDG